MIFSSKNQGIVLLVISNLYLLEKMKIINLLFVVFIGTSITYGQSGRLKRADKYYVKLSYDNAARLYEKLVGSDEDTPAMKAKLADSYYQMGDYQNSEKYYRQTVYSDLANPDDFYAFAQVLKQNGKYDESDVWMEKFHQKKPSDSRGKAFASTPNYLSIIEKQDPWFSYRTVSINEKTSEFGGYFSPDNTKVYFLAPRNRKSDKAILWSSKTFLDLYSAEVGNNNQLSKVKREKKANTKFHEGPLCFSPDKKYVYLTRSNIDKKKKNRKDSYGIRNLKIVRASLDANGKWSKEQELPFCSKDYSVGHPTISKDGKTLYFASDMPGGLGGSDLYQVEIKEDGSFGQPINLGHQINTEGHELFPWINEKGALFFSSDGWPGLGGLDIYACTASKSGFSRPTNLGRPVNSKNDDFAFTMKSDGKTGFYSSNREGGKGGDDIYFFVQLKELIFNKTIKGETKDNKNEPLAEATVHLYNESGTLIATTTSDKDGHFTFEVEPEKTFSLNGKKEKYFEGKTSVNSDTPDTEIPATLILEKDPGISLYAIVTDKKTGHPLAGVKMIIADNITGKEFIYITKESGDLKRPLHDKKINDRVSYTVTLQKEGYFTKTVTYNTVFDKEGQYNVNAKLNLSLDPEVKDLSQMVTLNPINFDLGKFNIRPDAAKELDKIVEVMNQYPNMVIELGAHTDCRGSAKTNEVLSDKRARASANYIKTKITNPDRIYGKGYGESRLLNDCECEGKVVSPCTEEQHAANRRTEFKVVSTGDEKVKVKNTSPDSF